MDIQADYFPGIVHEQEIQEEEPLAALAQLSTLMGPTISMQQLLPVDTVMAPQRSPTPPESFESSPDMIMVDSPPTGDKDDDEGDVAIPTPQATLPPDGEASLSPRQVAGRFRCPQCPDTALMMFTRKFDMNRHITRKHQEGIPKNSRELTCPCCYKTLSRPDAFRRHILMVPESCLRYSKVRTRARPPQPDSLYELCRAGNPPLPDRMSNSLES